MSTLFVTSFSGVFSEFSDSFSEVVELSSEEIDFFFKKSCFLLAFRLTEDGLSFFLTSLEVVASPLVPKEKVKSEPIDRENLKGLPWESMCRQKSMHWVARVA